MSKPSNRPYFIGPATVKVGNGDFIRRLHIKHHARIFNLILVNQTTQWLKCHWSIRDGSSARLLTQPKIQDTDAGVAWNVNIEVEDVELVGRIEDCISGDIVVARVGYVILE